MAFEDNFKGDTAALLGSIEALLNLAAVNALVPPVPAMPLQLLQSAAARLSTPAEESAVYLAWQPIETAPAEAQVAALRKALEGAISDILDLAHARWSEVEATDEQLVGNYRAVLASSTVARAVYPVPAGWRLVPETANDGWWHTLANLRQGRSPTPRCEAPSEYELRMCREIINEVLAAAPAPPKAETGADHG